MDEASHRIQHLLRIISDQTKHQPKASKHSQRIMRFGWRNGWTTPQNMGLAIAWATKPPVSSSMTPRKFVWIQMASTLTIWNEETLTDKMLERSIRSLITRKIFKRKWLYCNISEVIWKEQKSQILIKRCLKMFRDELEKSKMWSTWKSGCEHDMLSCSDFQIRSCRSTSKIILKSCSVLRQKWSPT